MRFHDFHLAGYTVRRFGKEIVLHLVYDYPEGAKTESNIKFSEVAAYNFVHTGGAIITDIEEISLIKVLSEVHDQLAAWWKQHGGYIDWDDDRSKYQAALEAGGYRAWVLGAAIGFEGFVIAKAVEEIPSETPSPT